jgi:acyl-CoA synthetase (NDP forming)
LVSDEASGNDLSGAIEEDLGALFAGALAAGRAQLLETEARQVLTAFGVPLPSYRIATTIAEAASAAAEVGFPVALKAVVANVLHKTEAGAVELSLPGEREVTETCRRMRAHLGPAVEGYVVERMAEPGLDLLIGVTSDPVFGQVVGLGLGGSLVEFHALVEFRQVPVSSDDAWDLVRSERLRLGDLRLRQSRMTSGAGLHDMLMKIAGPDGLVMRCAGKLQSLELNPVRMRGDRLVALDVKMLLRQQATVSLPTTLRATGTVDMSNLFRPRSIAYYGASPDPAKLGTRILQSLVEFGFRGPIHVVHPSAGTIAGIPCIRSLKDANIAVDYAYIAVPRALVPEAVDDCAGHAMFAHILTSGFGEYEEEGRALQERFLKSARSGGVRLIGPNCIGLYSPRGQVTCIEQASPQAGRVAFVSQSGGLATDAIRTGPTLGLHFSKVVSIGNCADLDAADFVAYLAEDDETAVIAMYVEAVRSGTRLLEAVARGVARGKPVVVLKGGRSARGARAAALHTDSIVTNHDVWDGVLRQVGAMTVDTFEDLLDVVAFLQRDSMPKGDRTLIIGQGGGTTVLVADECQRLGLGVPALQETTTEALLKTGLFPSVVPDNPIDSPVGVLQAKEGRALGEIVNLVLSEEPFSLVVVHINLQNVFAYTREPELIIGNALDGLVTVRQQHGLPIIVVFRANGEPRMESARVDLQVRASKNGLSVAPTTAAALKLASLMSRFGSKPQGAAVHAAASIGT